MRPFRPLRALRRFAADEGGAVSVDWIVLTAVLIGTAMAVIGAVRDGVQHLTLDQAAALRGAVVRASFEGPLCRGGLDAVQALEDTRAGRLAVEPLDVAAWLAADGARMSDGALLAARAGLRSATPAAGWAREATELAALDCEAVRRGLH
jgi:hypothetical protein